MQRASQPQSGCDLQVVAIRKLRYKITDCMATSCSSSGHDLENGAIGLETVSPHIRLLDPGESGPDVFAKIVLTSWFLK